MEIFLRTQYNQDGKIESDRTGLNCKDKSLTQQQFKDSSDINVLFGKYLETGELPQVEGLEYGDFTGIFDFQSAMNAVRLAEESFQTLPAKIKNRFDNNPQKLVEFINDPENREEAEFLKLVKPKTETLAGEPTLEARQPHKPGPVDKSDATGAAGNRAKKDAAEPQS